MNNRVDAWVMYPEGGRTYDVAMSGNYDVNVTHDSRGRIDIDFSSRMRQRDFTGARFTITPEVAQWLGLALLRASLQREREQRVEVRTGPVA